MANLRTADFDQPQAAEGFEFSFPGVPLAAQSEKGFEFSLPQCPKVRISPSRGADSSEGFEFFGPDARETLHFNFGKFFGGPKTAFPFIISFLKWRVLANLRTAGFERPQGAEGFEFSSAPRAPLTVRVLACFYM